MSRSAFMAMSRVALAISALCVGASAPAPPPDPASAARAQLLAGEWILKDVTAHMGSAGCTGGKTYVFKASPPEVTIGACEAGRWVKTKASWSLAQPSALDTTVTIDGRSYTVLFRKAGGVQQMLLRRRDGAGKAVTTTDEVFRLSDD